MNLYDLYFAKTNENAIIPSKLKENGAYDLYACFEEDSITIHPFESKLIPTGICTAFSSDYVMLFRERGSTGIKNMNINAGVIDSGYRGEIFVLIYNGNKRPIVITKEEENKDDGAIFYPYKKAIAQAVMTTIPNLTVREISLEELNTMESVRMYGKLGSSNK